MSIETNRMNVKKANGAERQYNSHLEVVKENERVKLVHLKEMSLNKRSRISDSFSIPFKDWRMPEQPSGYIKPRVYDYL